MTLPIGSGAVQYNRADAIARRVAELIEAERVAQGVTQKQLGAMMGITQPTVSRYLAVDVRMSVGHFIAFCASLGLPPGDVIARADDETATR